MSDSAELLTVAARPHPRRADAGIYPERYAVPVRLSDIDVFGHIGNVAMNGLHQEARAGVLNRVWPPVDGVRPVQTIAAQNVAHYLVEGFYPGSLQCCAGIGRVGTSSFVVATAVFDQAATALSVADTVMVVRVDGVIAPITQAWRDRLDALALRA